MKLSLKKYDAAKKAVGKLKIHQKTISDWEAAVNKIGDVGRQRIVSIEIKSDGTISTQCEANGKPVEK